MELKLRCFAEQEPDGSWYVHCIDLTLDAHAPTYLEARKKLDEAIIGYVDWGLKHATSPGELLRPSPLEFRLRYGKASLVMRLRAVIDALRRRAREASTPDETFSCGVPVNAGAA